MTILLWLLAGAAVGWLGFVLARWNRRRGMLASVMLGALGGGLGGALLEPAITNSPVVSGDLNMHALFMAAVAAAACLAVANLMEGRPK